MCFSEVALGALCATATAAYTRYLVYTIIIVLLYRTLGYPKHSKQLKMFTAIRRSTRTHTLAFANAAPMSGKTNVVKGLKWPFQWLSCHATAGKQSCCCSVAENANRNPRRYIIARTELGTRLSYSAYIKYIIHMYTMGT